MGPMAGLAWFSGQLETEPRPGHVAVQAASQSLQKIAENKKNKKKLDCAILKNKKTRLCHPKKTRLCNHKRTKNGCAILNFFLKKLYCAILKKTILCNPKKNMLCNHKKQKNYI